MKWMFVVVLALFAVHRPAQAEECFQINTVQGPMDGVSGGRGCQPSIADAANALYAVGKPYVEKTKETSDYVETKTLIQGSCSQSRMIGSFPPYIPEIKCTYQVKTVTEWKRQTYVSTTFTDAWFLIWHTCGEAFRTTYSYPDQVCLRYIDRAPSDQSCPAKTQDPWASFGNPINAITGLKSQREAILEWGRGHRLSLTYDYSDALVGASIARFSPQGFGPFWHGNFHRSVIDTGNDAVMFIRGDGSLKTYKPSAGWGRGERDPAPIRTSSGWRYADASAEALETYRNDGTGELLQIAYIDGRRLDLTYADFNIGGTSTRRVLQKVTDEAGRTLSFEYESDPGYVLALRIKRAIDAGGRSYTFTYADGGGLVSIGYPDGVSRRYEYGRGDLPWAITSLIDEGNSVLGTYRYDAGGRAIATETGTVGPRWTVNWGTPPRWVLAEELDLPNRIIWRTRVLVPGEPATVTGPADQTSVLASTSVAGSVALGSRSQPAGAGCEAATSSLEHDADANVVRRVDFNGGQSCHAYVPGRRLESTSVEGLSVGTACASVLPVGSALAAGSRKISREWHPDWRRERRVAEPRRITTLVYNGQPDPFNGNAVASCAPADAKLPDGKPIVVLCKRVEQATTDETGALGFNAVLQSGVPARASSWTYNATGQVLTETDPLNQVVVTNEYYADTTAEHTKGDLKSTTNALNQKTSVIRYDAYGKPLETVDANALTTTYVYDLRERLTSTTSDGVTTSYEYFPTGLLKKASQADGSAVNYEYDDAHRLVAASDTRGNRIDYTLDRSGNRTGETAKDPQGALKRTMSRAFDALNRAQQTTGRE